MEPRRRRGVEAAAVAIAMAVVGGRVLWQSAQRPPCPQGYAEDARREERALRLLEGDDDGREAVRNASGVRGRVCFGSVEVPAVTTDRTLVLRRDAGDGENAARLAHLFHHLERPFAPIDGFDAHAPCAPQVDAALVAEADALDLELRERERLHVDAPVLRFAFLGAWHAAPTHDARLALLHAYLVAHPHGGGGIDALGDAYAARCQEVTAGERR